MGAMVSIDARPFPLDLNPDATAVIVVDMLEGFGGRGGWWDAAGVEIGGIRAVIPSIRAALDAARRTSIPIVYLRMDLDGPDDPGDPRLAHYYRQTRSLHPSRVDRLPEGVRQSDIIGELAPHKGDLVINKPSLSGFFETDLDARLRTLGVSSLVFTGCTTSICVDSTLRDGFFRGYVCLLLEDCCAEPIGHQFERTNHDATVYQVETSLGWVTQAARFVEAMGQGSSNTNDVIRA